MKEEERTNDLFKTVAAEPGPSFFSFGKSNILIVDDRPDKLFSYQVILEETGQNIFLAHSGQEALTLAGQHDFAVILLDVDMPGMDGFQTAAYLRKRPESAHMPIIFLTAFNDNMYAAQGYASGAVDYLSTPVMPEILLAKVRVFIELSHARAQLAVQVEDRARRAEAEESERRKDEFLAMLTHELRNPLGPILNGAQLLKKMSPQEPTLIDLCSMVERQAAHMARLVDDLLDTTRLARGLVRLCKEKCSLNDIVGNVVADYKNIFQESGLVLDVVMPEQDIRIEGDATRLTQVLGNLLHNAHKFTSAGGCVSVTLKDEGTAAHLSVSDTGIGIAPDMIDSIFKVFRQGDQGLERGRGGLGLGLALVKGLVELHGGIVRAESAGLGQGAVFKIVLPLTQRVSCVQDNRNLALPPVNPDKNRVMVIEDNRDTADSLKMLLSLRGYDVRVAYTGRDGLDAARLFRPQIVLCDIGLPSMDGYQVVREMRSDPSIARAHIVALSGYGRDEDRRRSWDAGFDMHLTKPVDHKNLFQIISAF